MSLLETFITTQIFIFLAIFARVGCAMMVMPGFGDSTFPMQFRLFLALTLSLVLIPVLQPMMPATPPTQPIAFALFTAHEMLVGLFVGMMAQMMMNAVHLAGVLVAHSTSLSSAFTFNPQMATQSSVMTSFLSLLAVILIFVTDIHHLLLMGMIDSYRLFPTNGEFMAGDVVNTFAESLGESLMIGLMMAAPFVVVAFGVFVAMGLVARLVPQIQVFILSIPVQIITGMITLMTAISAMMLYFMEEYEAFWKAFM